DGIQRRAQLVRQGRQELVLDPGAALSQHARVALGLEHRLALRAARLEGLGALSFGQVSRQLGESAQAAGVVAQGRDVDVRPEPRAVLAQAPAFVDEAPLRRRHAQLVLRPAALHGVLGIELAEVLPDDFLGTVPLDPAGAVIPGLHDAIDVEHEDRVLAHPLDEQAKPLLALPQTVLVLAPLGQVARDFRKSDQLLVGTEERGDDDVRPEARSILPDAPAFVLEASVCRGDLQLMRREVARLGRIELAEVLADDLRGAVALDPLGAGVPGENVAVGIEHENGVVLDALHQKAKALIALSKRLLAMGGLGHVCGIEALIGGKRCARAYSPDARVKASPVSRAPLQCVLTAASEADRAWIEPRKRLERQAVRTYPDDAAVLPHQG